MFTPRADIADCSGLDNPEACSAPSDSDVSQGIDPSFMQRQAAHRYIGIGMVAGLILIIFLVWLYRGKWPRKMLQQCCSRCSKQSPKNMDDETPTLIRSPDRDKSTMGGSETRRLVKEVSAGMMVFTKAPNALRGKERFPMEWEMDHVDDTNSTRHHRME